MWFYSKISQKSYKMILVESVLSMLSVGLPISKLILIVITNFTTENKLDKFWKY